MTDHVSALFAGIAMAAVVGMAFASLLTRRPPRRLIRVNVNGREVPAVLGLALVAGALAGLLAAAAVASAADPLSGSSARPRTLQFGWFATMALIVALMGMAGALDDARGDEQARGFRGHLAALREGRVTGGIVKIGAGLVAGVAAALLLRDAAALNRILCVLLVPLAANLVNLLDRAPGRASKAGLLLAVVIAAVERSAWTVAAAPVLAATAVTLPMDLRERGMLGDAGANALGAAVGLGLAVALPTAMSLVALAGVLALNLASERVSFSRVIDSNPLLRMADRAGRRSADLTR